MPGYPQTGDAMSWSDIMGGATSDGNWHYFEFEFNPPAGTFDVWVDNKHGYLTGIDYTGWHWDGQVQLATNQAYASNGGCAYRMIDDIAVSTTGRIGPLNTIISASITAFISNTVSSATLSINQGTLPAGYADKFFVNADYTNTANPADDPFNTLAATLTTGNNTTIMLPGLKSGTLYRVRAARYDGNGTYVGTWTDAGFVGAYNGAHVWTLGDRVEVGFESPFVLDFSKPFGETSRPNMGGVQAYIPAHRRVYDSGLGQWKLVIDTTDINPQWNYPIITPNRLWSTDHDITMQMTFKMSGDYWYHSNVLFASDSDYWGYINPDSIVSPQRSQPIYGNGSQYRFATWDHYGNFPAGYFYVDQNTPVTTKLEYLANNPVAGQSTLNVYVNGNLVNHKVYSFILRGPVNLWTAFLDYVLTSADHTNANPSQTEILDYRVWGTQVYGTIGGNNSTTFLDGLIPGSSNNAGHTLSLDDFGGSIKADVDIGAICARNISGAVIVDTDTFGNATDSLNGAFHTKTPLIGVPSGSGKKYGNFKLYGRQGIHAGSYLSVQFRDGYGNLVPDNLITLVGPAEDSAQVNSTGFRSHVENDLNQAPTVLDLSNVPYEVWIDVQGQNNDTALDYVEYTKGPSLIEAFMEFQNGTELARVTSQTGVLGAIGSPVSVVAGAVFRTGVLGAVCSPASAVMETVLQTDAIGVVCSPVSAVTSYIVQAKGARTCTPGN